MASRLMNMEAVLSYALSELCNWSSVIQTWFKTYSRVKTELLTKAFRVTAYSRIYSATPFYSARVVMFGKLKGRHVHTPFIKINSKSCWRY